MLSGEIIIGVDELADLLVDLFDLVVDSTHGSLDVLLDKGGGRRFQAAGFLGVRGGQLSAAEDQGIKFLLKRASEHRGPYFFRQPGGELGEHAGVELVGFGAQVHRFSEVFGLLGLNAVDRELFSEAGGNKQVLVGARGFQNDACGGVFDEMLDEGVDAFGGIFEGSGGRIAGDRQIEAVFAHVDAGVTRDGGR